MVVVTIGQFETKILRLLGPKNEYPIGAEKARINSRRKEKMMVVVTMVESGSGVGGDDGSGDGERWKRWWWR